ncbi:MAG: hypothetical protein Q8Q40_13855 [Methylococcaceae bacterium]|nr:hypothetical protein [Methylococcaceae bacterium]MDP3905041.1 hypothetical protein [Methylococcaceae bacterium]
MSLLNKRLMKLEDQQAAKVVESRKLSPQEIVDKIKTLLQKVTERQARVDAGLEVYPTSPNNTEVDCKALAAKICGMYELAKLQVGNEQS